MHEERFTRPEFRDRLLEPRALWAAAEMWRGFFVHSGFLRSGQYQLRAEVWGFPRSDLPAVEAALRQAAGASCDVSAVEPDRLVVAGGWSALDTAVATKPWLAPLLTPACGNLFVVLRMEVRNVAPGAGRRPRSSNALVMAGVAEDRSFVLKACGHSTGSRISERLCHGMAWAHESAFLRSLDEFLRASPEAEPQPPAGATSADATRSAWLVGNAIVSDFRTRLGEHVNDWLARHFVEFPDDRTPSAFLRRCLFPLALLLGCGWVGWVRRELRGGAGIAAVIGLGLLCRVLWTKVKVIWQFHRRMNRGLSALYAKPLAFEKRVIETALLAEPALRKYSGDLVAAGAEHCYDFRLVHQGEHESICRLYVDRAAHAYIGLSVMTRAGQFHLFPGKPIFVLTTYFNDGTRCATISSAKTYRKAMDPRVVAAARAGTSDPAAMLRIHRTLVEREVATGRTAEPVDPESFGQRTVDEHAESQSYYATHPIYTWGDALHEAFKVPRKLERLVGNRKPD